CSTGPKPCTDPIAATSATRFTRRRRRRPPDRDRSKDSFLPEAAVAANPAGVMAARDAGDAVVADVAEVRVRWVPKVPPVPMVLRVHKVLRVRKVRRAPAHRTPKSMRPGKPE